VLPAYMPYANRPNDIERGGVPLRDFGYLRMGSDAHLSINSADSRARIVEDASDRPRIDLPTKALGMRPVGKLGKLASVAKIGTPNHSMSAENLRGLLGVIGFGLLVATAGSRWYRSTPKSSDLFKGRFNSGPALNNFEKVALITGLITVFAVLSWEYLRRASEAGMVLDESPHKENIMSLLNGMREKAAGIAPDRLNNLNLVLKKQVSKVGLFRNAELAKTLERFCSPDENDVQKELDILSKNYGELTSALGISSEEERINFWNELRQNIVTPVIAQEDRLERRLEPHVDI
jgi:hypothetical protein